MAVILYLHVLFAIFASAIAEIEMEFTRYPESVTAPPGDQVTFECAVRVPGGRLAWRWRPVEKPGEEWKEVAGTSDKESMSTRLVVEVKEDTPNSYYQCVVWYGAVSLASIPARLTVARLELGRNTPAKRVLLAPARNTVVLHCREPLSDPPATLSWWRETAKGHREQMETPHGVLVLHNVTTADSGVYGCTAANELTEQRLDLPETTHLKVETDWNKGIRFLESKEYVGTIDNEGDLTVSVKVNDPLRLWCGAVDAAPPRVAWINPQGKPMPQHRDHLVVEAFSSADEGVYTCTAGSLHPIRRSWKVAALEAPAWEDAASNVTVGEGGSVHISCGAPIGRPAPAITWLLNAEPIKTGKVVRTVGADLYIDRVEKKHAGIVQCFACNKLGCAYDAALLTVVPVQISDQEYPAEASTLHFPPHPAKKHNRKNNRKHKALLIPPSKPNVTRMSDESVMVTWSHPNHGLPISFFKIQYREANNSSNAQWQTSNYDILPHINSFEIDNLKPDRYYKFRIAAVYTNQDNKLGKSSGRFYLQRGGFQGPRAPVLAKAVPVSSQSIQLVWTWSSDGGVQAVGFYVYYRVSTTAGAYEKLTVPGGAGARSVVLTHLTPDTSYELKLQAYAAQAPSDFSAILVARTHKSSSAPGTTTQSPAEDMKNDVRAPGALVTAGGALGAAALLVILGVTLLLCRRAKRPPSDKVKGPAPESGAANGYLPAKVPITITANPMHAEGGDGGVEMSFLHNNNCGNTGGDDTLPHSRKNGTPNRQYV